MNSTTYYPPFTSRGKSNFSAEAVIAIVSAVLTVLVPVAGFTIKRLFSQRSKTESVEGTGTGGPDMATTRSPCCAIDEKSTLSIEAIIGMFGVAMTIFVPLLGFVFKKQLNPDLNLVRPENLPPIFRHAKSYDVSG
ncbi:hypothetical protein HDK77DRAFT_478245 [Phyllosticta capitalensis]